VGFLTDLHEGFAQLLAADVNPAQNLAWQPSGAYPIDKTGIFIRHVPASPNRIVVLSSYGLSDDAVYADSDVGLQVRTRSAGEDPRDVDDLDEAIADVLLGRFPFTLTTGIRIVTLTRSSAAPLGQDANHRWERTSNFALGLHRPGPHRL
jgi:hypothetical protein